MVLGVPREDGKSTAVSVATQVLGHLVQKESCFTAASHPGNYIHFTNRGNCN